MHRVHTNTHLLTPAVGHGMHLGLQQVRVNINCTLRHVQVTRFLETSCFLGCGAKAPPASKYQKKQIQPFHRKLKEPYWFRCIESTAFLLKACCHFSRAVFDFPTIHGRVRCFTLYFLKVCQRNSSAPWLLEHYYLSHVITLYSVLWIVQ